ncbi:MAG: ABC transporter substrate-binding protein [Ignavibacteriaceae bacterium]
MSSKSLHLLFLSILFIFFFGCDSKQTNQNNRIVIGIAADVQTFNTLFAFSLNEGVITELLYPSLVDFKWNEDRGDLEAFPMIAKSWQWAEDSSFIKFSIRDDVLWTDGQKLTAEDVVFSFDLFSDPEVESRLFGTFRQFYTESDNHIDIDKTFKIISPFEFQINFPLNSVPNLIEFILPIIPKHVYENIERTQLANYEGNFNPVSCGAFKLKTWERNQSITLVADSNSFLFRPDQISELVFKVVPDYTSRILQLKKGEIDLIEQVKVEDINELNKDENLVVVPVFGREYDYIGWNNLDPLAYSKEQIIPNKLFGSSNVRKALTMAINRKEIFEEYLQGYGKLAASPVSPIFKSVINENVMPYDFNPAEAKKLLALEGWKDENSDGILEKGNDVFRFTMYYPVGNPLREYAATVIKNNLKSVGVELNPEKIELGAFIDNLYEKKIDSWMAAWYVPIPLELKAYWYSDPDVTPLNFGNYNNADVDKILDQLQTRISEEKKNELIREFQQIIHQDEPVTFLYWTPNITVYNKRLKNLDINPFGVVGHCWEWTLNE